jgi:hypothetical protein
MGDDDVLDAVFIQVFSQTGEWHKDLLGNAYYLAAAFVTL